MSEKQHKAEHRSRPNSPEFRAFIARGWADRDESLPEQTPAAPYAAARRAAVSEAYPGERVVVQMGNVPAFYAMVIGLMRAGLLPVYALPAHRLTEIAHFVHKAQAAAWVALQQHDGYDYRELARQHPNTLSLRTFSKAWGLAGLRLGYMLAGTELAAQQQKLISAFNVNVLTQCALEVALEHPGYVQRRVQEGVAERERVLAALRGHPNCQALASSANYFLLRTPDPDAAYRHLLDHGIVVRRQDSLHLLSGCLRISLGTPAENDALLAALAQLR